MRYEIRELGVGGILDRAVSMTKNHFGLLLGVMLVLQIPYGLITGFVQLSLAPEIPANPTPQDIAAIQQAAVANLWITFPMILLGAFVVVPVTNAALIHAIASEYLEKAVTVGEAFSRAFSILLPLIGTWLLVYLAVMGGMILLIIPGILCAFWFALATQVVVIEGVAGFQALKRSKALMKGNIGTFFVLGLLIGVITIGINLGIQFVPERHLQVVVAVLLQAVAGFFGAAAVVAFYFSCRCGHEHFDLTLLAEGVGIEASEQSTDGLSDDAWEA